MTILDKTGRKLKIGQLCDIMLVGMFQGQLIKIEENPISIPTKPPIPPHIALAVSITPFIDPRSGYVPDVYIIQDVDPRESKKIEDGLLIGRTRVD